MKSLLQQVACCRWGADAVVMLEHVDRPDIVVY